MKISRRFTTASTSPFATTAWVTRTSKITNPDGSVVFQMDDALVPEGWSQLATDIMVSKYFRKAGVPQDGGPNGIASDKTERRGIGGTGVPPVSPKANAKVSGLTVTGGTPVPPVGNAGGTPVPPVGNAGGTPVPPVGNAGGTPVPPVGNTGGTPVPPASAESGPEKSAAQVIHRLAGCWRHWGEEHGYFHNPESAQVFYDEIVYMMVHQMAAPNSPQWFNTGLNWAYGLTGPAQGHFVPDPKTGEVHLAHDAYTHPQPHACFIQSVGDDLVADGGIMDLWVREARLFKYGSGTGTNFSNLRGEGEKLSGGGKSSGLMSWLKIGDRAASAIKSGGTTRRAAKMVCLDMDHPDIGEFINWKVREEIKVQAMVEGLKVIADKKSSPGDSLTIGETARKLGLKLDYDFNGEAYLTVSGQNSNNSVRIGDDFFKTLDAGADWTTHYRIKGKEGKQKVAKTYKSNELWEQIGYAAWRCADPGVQFDTTINAWHTCPGAGRINASNPCVTGDTLIATTNGLRRISELVGQEVEVINGRGEPSYVERVFKTGTKPVYELRTASGYRLRLTGDHLVETTNRGDVPACELTVDDEVRLISHGFGIDFEPVEAAELIGAAVGDGCLTHQPDQDFLFVSLSGEEAAVADRLRADIDACKRLVSTGDARGERPTNVVATPTGLRVGTSVEAVLTRLTRYAVLDQGSESKRFTDAIHSLDRATQAAILRGLFTTDGTVADYADKSQYVALDSTSLELLRQVQLVLLGFGIKAKIYENRRALGQTTARLPDGRGGVADYPVRQLHSLRISRSSRVEFEKSIGFLPQSPKARRLAEMNAKTEAYADRMTDRVESLTPAGVEDVFDLTEPLCHHFVANGIVVHNCSEYMFLDNTACNLASINVLKFYDSKTREFDWAAYEHAIDLWTIVLEISVLMAAYPSKEVAQLSWKYRTLGLGYANLGAMLMQAGISYDSDGARAVCACLSAILTGRSYRQSALMAAEHGPFPGFTPERDSMLRVVRNHRRAAYGVKGSGNTGGTPVPPVSGSGGTGVPPVTGAAGAYEQLSIPPVAVDHAAVAATASHLTNAPELGKRATLAWDEALALGETHGFRNAQSTVIAPTGTIGLLMDCDTTGIEPDFALVKFKKLAGGGYFKIANASVKPALEALGYSPAQMRDILIYLLGTLSTDVAMPGFGAAGGTGVPPVSPMTFAQWLKTKGLTDADLVVVNDALPGVFEVSFAFNAWTLGDDAMKRLGIDPDGAKADPAFNLLKTLGLSKAQINELNELICGTQTIEGAPHLKAEDVSVFDCANKCGKKGRRFIHPHGHIRMMAAAQPFISGAISKTINLPNEATVKDITECYRLSWELGLKANALYRDGCKLSQPLNSGSDDAAAKDEETAPAAAATPEAQVKKSAGSDLAAAQPVATTLPASIQPTIPVLEPLVSAGGTGVPPVSSRPIPRRRRLPDTRASITHKFKVANHEGYLTVGLYEDGMPGELFITMAKEGSTIGGLMDSLGTATSVSLQYGVPIQSLVTKFTHQRFEPAGMTGNPDIPFAKSLVDYIFRWLGMEFIPGYREENAPKRGGDADSGGGGGHRDQHAEMHRRHVQAVNTTRDVLEKPAAPAHADGSKRGFIGDVTTAGGGGRSSPGHSMGPSMGLSHDSGLGTGVAGGTQTLSAAMASAMGDAPACDGCGAITVRSGTCYKCLNCGNSMGCS